LLLLDSFVGVAVEVRGYGIEMEEVIGMANPGGEIQVGVEETREMGCLLRSEQTEQRRGSTTTVCCRGLAV